MEESNEGKKQPRKGTNASYSTGGERKLQGQLKIVTRCINGSNSEQYLKKWLPEL